MQTADIEQPKLVKEAMDAYFEAMAAGWVGGGKTKAVVKDGYFVITTQHGAITVVDRYNDDGGTTTILMNNKPVWQMEYEGRYPKEVIPFLKQALMKNIEAKHFFGGRGPRIFVGREGFIYKNEVHGDFSSFSGVETICNAKGLIGSHQYSGGFLPE